MVEEVRRHTNEPVAVLEHRQGPVDVPRLEEFAYS